jgi:hypothetical protein
VNPGSAEAGRDGLEIEALRTDRYLESLLVARGRGDRLSATDAALDPNVRRASDRLLRDLVRVHPSFRFEERLARLLAAAAGDVSLPPRPAGAENTVLAFPGDRAVTGHTAFAVAVPLDTFAIVRGRPLLIGGAMASAALSIAGAAWVAWRLSRPAGRTDPMTRAVRRAHSVRIVAPVLRAPRWPRLD